jgi:hypothetical protein
MLSPDDTTQVGQTTEELDVVSLQSLNTTSQVELLATTERPSQRLHGTQGRRHPAAQHRQTGALPQPPTDTPGARVAWRQAVQLREENRRLRQEVDELRVELRSLIIEYTDLQNRQEQETSVIHTGHQQEIEQYEQHLRELTYEHDQMQEAQQYLERRYQELYYSFQEAVKDEVRKTVMEAANTVELIPNVTPEALQNVKKTIHLQVLQEEDEHLLETMYLKREVQQMVDALDQQQKQLEEERQRTLVLQNSIREQAEQRLKIQQSRLKIRWRAALTINTIAIVVALITLQYLFLFLNHTLSPSTGFALTAPVIICIILACILSGPLAMAKAIYTSAPHKKRVKESA